MEVLLRVEGCDDTFLAVDLDATVASVRSQAGNGDWDFTLDSGSGDAEVLSDDVRLCDLPAEDGIVLRARLCQRLAAQHEIADRFPDAVFVLGMRELCPCWFVTRFLNRADGSLHDEGTRLLRLVRQAHGVAPLTDPPTYDLRLSDTLNEGAVCTLLEACMDAGLPGGTLYWQLCRRVVSFESVRGAAILAKCPSDDAGRFELLLQALAAPTIAITLIEAGFPCRATPSWATCPVSIVQSACTQCRRRSSDVAAAALNAGYVATASDLSNAIRNERTEAAELLLQHCVKRGVPLDRPGKDAPIVVAARGNHTKIMQVLLEAGVGVSAASGPGRAVCSSFVRLLRRSANASAQRSRPETQPA